LDRERGDRRNREEMNGQRGAMDLCTRVVPCMIEGELANHEGRGWRIEDARREILATPEELKKKKRSQG